MSDIPSPTVRQLAALQELFDTHKFTRVDARLQQPIHKYLRKAWAKATPDDLLDHHGIVDAEGRRGRITAVHPDLGVTIDYDSGHVITHSPAAFNRDYHMRRFVFLTAARAWPMSPCRRARSAEST